MCMQLYMMGMLKTAYLLMLGIGVFVLAPEPFLVVEYLGFWLLLELGISYSFESVILELILGLADIVRGV